MRFIAVDWSAALRGDRKKIWLAEVEEGRHQRLENDRSRQEVIEHIVEETDRDPELVLGLDFAFSLPAWFLERRGHSCVEDMWADVARNGEDWLRNCAWPFWGRGGIRRHELPAHFRRTEQHESVGGSTAKSVFQINFPGAVGTGSLRGMPYLRVLRSAGFAIWPFHEPRLPLALEIYPRILTGPVTKSSLEARQCYLASGFPEITSEWLDIAASSDDAFDAAVSAVIMSRHEHEIADLEKTTDPVECLEGRIWSPARLAPRAADDPHHPGLGAATPCPFCGALDHAPAQRGHAFALPDAYPVSHGHTLVVPKRHVASVFALNREEQADLWKLVDEVRHRIASERRPDGFTIGVNDGTAAGQTVDHAHVHVIPRFHGDVPDPRGGVRQVIPHRAAYWSDELEVGD